MTNDRYKSVLHRAIVNNTGKRISVVTGHAPSVDTVVVPLPELLEKEGQSPAYKGVSYKEYMEIKLVMYSLKSALESIRI